MIIEISEGLPLHVRVRHHWAVVIGIDDAIPVAVAQDSEHIRRTGVHAVVVVRTHPDQRSVAVDRDLAEGGYVQCHACRRPLSTENMASADYREGVSCPLCINEADEDRLARLEERRKQVALAAARGESHIGPKS